jgi:hypothetical protein
LPTGQGALPSFSSCSKDLFLAMAASASSRTSRKKRPLGETLEAAATTKGAEPSVMPPPAVSYFRCKYCGSRQFEISLSSKGAGQVNISLNDNADVVIETPKRRFLADLGFMQQFARCGECLVHRCWEYSPLET